MFAKSVIVSAFAAAAAAQLHAPTTQWPTQNPIGKPELGEAVAAGSDYTITWKPDTTNSVSLLLLKGPSENVVPIGAPIAQGIPNAGSYTFKVPTGLGACLNDNKGGFGIQLIDDVTGEYQFSVQFCVLDESAPSSTPSAPASTTPSSTPEGYPTATPSSKEPSSKYPVESTPSSTPVYEPTTKPPVYTPTGYPITNSTSIKPTGSGHSTLLTTGTPTTTDLLPTFTGAAANVRAGLGLVAGIAGALFML